MYPSTAWPSAEPPVARRAQRRPVSKSGADASVGANSLEANPASALAVRP